MSNYQDEKQLIRRYYPELDNCPADQVAAVMGNYMSDQYLWRGYHPFNEQNSVESVARLFWEPLKNALSRMQRRIDIFIAGSNELDDHQSVWVVSMGHLMGLFDQSWLNIPPTGKMTFLRYCEFNKVENGKITETAMFFDIPHLMVQAGLTPFPPPTAAQLVQPGPMTHDALLFTQQDPLEGEKTLTVINDMINSLGNWDHQLTLEEELAINWHDDMIWWGPTGIGATYTIERYAKQHSGPFRESLTDRTFNGHVCRLAEGHFGGFFGWPNLTLTHTGGFMGMPATGKPADMRVIDMYRREGDKLAENWVFIDLLYFWFQHDVDILERTTRLVQP